MTEPHRSPTVDAPVAQAPRTGDGSTVIRLLAGLAGGAILLVGSLAIVGAPLAAAVAIWIAAILAARRGRRLTRGGAWASAIAGAAVCTLAVSILFVRDMPAGTWSSILTIVDSVARSPSTPAQLPAPERDSLLQASEQTAWSDTFLPLWLGIGAYIGFAVLAVTLGTVGWGASMLLVFAFTGRWLERGRRAPAAV